MFSDLDQAHIDERVSANNNLDPKIMLAKVISYLSGIPAMLEKNEDELISCNTFQKTCRICLAFWA